jgi:hypothetical protein
MPASIEGQQKQGRGQSKQEIDNFQGRMVVIDGQRYLQARKGVSASSGVPGSRIILDGLVFLKDDGFIDPDELYRKSTDSKSTAGNSNRSNTQEQNQLSDGKKSNSANKQIVKAETSKDEKSTAPDISNAAKASNKLRLTEEPGRPKQTKDLADQQPSEVEQNNDRAVLLAEKEAREQLLRVPKTPIVTPVYATNVNPETVLDEILRKHRRVELERSLRSREQDPALAQADSQTEATSNQQRSVDEVSRQLVVTTDPGDPAAAMPTQSQLNRITSPGRGRSDDFGYLDALPVSFDVGGNGVLLEGSAQSHSRFQYFGRLAVASSYTKVMLGGGYYLKPGNAARSTVVLLAGVEHGDFELTDDDRAPGEIFSVSDTGIHVGALTRLAISRKFELAGGIGYSSFFEGDTQFIGGGYYHVTPRLDIVSRFELGDNDLLGIGFRYYY